MELKLVILSLACFSCLAPPVYSHPILAAKLAAAGALKGAALIGAGILAKGAILKGAALLAAKGAVLGGAALLGAKAAALKAGAALAAKPVLLPSSVAVPNTVFVEKPVLVEKPALIEVSRPSVVISPPSLSNIGEKLNGVISATKDAVINKTIAVSELIASLLPSKTIVHPPRPVVYQIVSAPKFYPVPLFEKIVKKK